MGDCTLRLRKLTILPDGIAGTAAQKCREWGGCWECQIFSPRLPKVLTKIVEIATEIVNRHCRDCRDCWDCRECRYLQDCRDRRDSRPRLPGLPILPDENGWLHAEIEKIPEVAGGIAGTRETAAQKCRDCRGCWACRIFSRRLPKVLAKIVEIATEIAGRHWRDCKGCWECRECRYFQDCRDCRDCRPRLPGLPICPAANGWLHAETKKTDELAGRDCRDCRVWLPKMLRLPGLLGVMKRPNLQTEIAKNVGQPCRDCSGCWACQECG